MDPKLQHYVPQLLLSRFADDRGQVRTYDKQTKKYFLQNLKNAAAENHFYRLEFGDKPPSNEFERLMSTCEEQRGRRDRPHPRRGSVAAARLGARDVVDVRGNPISAYS